MQAKNNNDPWVPLNGKQTIKCVNMPPENAHGQNMLTSDEYIAKLEAKLKRMQKSKTGPSSKDIINSLAEVKEHQLNSMVQDTITPYVTCLEDSQSSNTSELSVSFLQKRLYPERQALTTEELQQLIANDELAKRILEDDVSDGDVEKGQLSEAEYQDPNSSSGS
ncbi:uncharacterized protein LOC106167584 [Lingula anatina]|uniref:Uncharacterized protein LOC106167584 n=1 Tax=Lingula anatina TaxID=7574 RepID=A0A1S3IWB1_LINAN|nr:uncharacterized protein LOC106167584 [Lingula anatina]|eukprot:XP_013401839.1 uncharacterized protein LOC106167584 [Lingula anatina]